MKMKCDLKHRILGQIVKKKGCWIWQGTISKADNYGKLCYKGKVIRAHRASYAVFKGEIPIGMFVCHTCDNPSCVNPEHLWIGTAKENTQDSIKKGRYKGWSGRKKTREEIEKILRNRTVPDQKGEKHGKSLLKNADIIEIRDMLKNGAKYREVAEKFGLRIGSVGDIKSKRTWAHI